MTPTPAHPAVDPERTEPRNAFDTPTGHSGQEYDRRRDAAETAGQVTPATTARESDRRDLPPEAGRRATIAPNGETRGSGMGAGGGAPGEDYDEGTVGAAPEVPQAGAGPDRQQG